MAFELVDASTQKPLAGVSTELLSYRHGLVLGDTERHTELPASGPDGRVVADGLSTSLSHSFLFRKDGYQDASAFYLAVSDRLAWDSPVPKPGPVSIPAVRVRGEVVVIPMYPRGASDSK